MTTLYDTPCLYSTNFLYTILRPVGPSWRPVGDTDPSRSLRGNPTHTHTHTQIKSPAVDLFRGIVAWSKGRRRGATGSAQLTLPTPNDSNRRLRVFRKGGGFRSTARHSPNAHSIQTWQTIS